MSDPAPSRIAALDLIRGIAVLGILAVNMAGFAGGPIGTLSPNFPQAGSAADNLAFATIFVAAEGKLRALFTLLFGASMLLLIERAEAAGRDGGMFQARRLVWLMLFGYLHFALLWWGDILFTYAVIGLVILPLRHQSVLRLTVGAVTFFVLWHALFMASTWPDLMADEAVRLGSANSAQLAEHKAMLVGFANRDTAELARLGAGFWQQAFEKIAQEPLMPLDVTISSLGETAPLMLLGMALYRSGFFSGGWPNRALRALAIGGIGLGGAITLLLLAWAQPRGFPPMTMFAFVLHWTALPHLLMGLGYAAALMLAAPWLLQSWIGQRLSAAGRMAFSNYIASTLVMTLTFNGWGFGLAGRVGHADQLWFVLLGWVLMLGWSKPWLVHFRQGPLEWLWRSLTERRRLEFRR